MNDLFFSDLELIKKDGKQYEAYQSMANTVVIAGPGSGKTRVLSLKAVTLAKTKITKPNGLACISFSRESVRELKKRLKAYGFSIGNKDFVGTVHSFSLLHVIQPFALLYPQYRIHYPIKILPYDVSYQIYRSVLSSLNITNERELSLTEISKRRSLSLTGRSTINIETTPLIKKAAQLYEDKLSQTEFIDFINIINLAAKIIHEQEYVRLSLQSKFPWLLVDEYQDLGKALHEMVLELVFNAGINLYAVGDVNQSIYGFNGGYPDFLRELTEYDDIHTVHLEANYRSSQHIIDASLETLQPTPPLPTYKAERRKHDVADFRFNTCEEEMKEQYEIVSQEVIPDLLDKGIPLNEIGVITASNTQIHEFVDFLEKKAIPFFIVNWSFENSAVLVWLQECALWCTDKSKQSFEELFKFWSGLLTAHKDPRKNWERIRLKTFFYNTLFDSLSYTKVYEWVNFIVNQLTLNKTLAGSEIYPNEVENIEHLLEEAQLRNLKNASLKRFANLGFPDNEVTVTTRHSSKGLEFEAIILLGMEEERFPHFAHLNNPSALAEDQRLCYVCISRAKRTCILVRSRFFTISTRKGPWRKEFKPSRYWVSLFNKFGNNNNTYSNH